MELFLHKSDASLWGLRRHPAWGGCIHRHVRSGMMCSCVHVVLQTALLSLPIVCIETWHKTAAYYKQEMATTNFIGELISTHLHTLNLRPHPILVWHDGLLYSCYKEDKKEKFLWSKVVDLHRWILQIKLVVVVVVVVTSNFLRKNYAPVIWLVH